MDYFSPQSGLPDYNQFTPESLSALVPQVRANIAKTKALADTLSAIAEPNWDNVVAVHSEHYETLAQLWGLIGHLHGTCDSPEVREVYNTLLPEMTELSSYLGQHRGLCRQWQAISDRADFSFLSSARQHSIRQTLRDFRLAGAALAEDQRQIFTRIEMRLAELSAKFSENLLDATNAFQYHTESAEALAGLPEQTLEGAKARAERAGKSGWMLSLQAPDYLSVMEYASNRALREHFYRHYATRASDQTPNGIANASAQWDNSALIQEMLALRAQKAEILGFADYRALSLASKMAKTADEVESFLLEIAQKARPFAEREYREVSAFAKTYTDEPLAVWDIPYYSRLLRESTYAYTDEEVKPYFPAPTVLSGLFTLCTSLFGIRFVEEPAPIWHPSVRFYRLIARDGTLRGGFYADLFARESKKSGAWMDETLSRGHYRQAFHYPVAYLICNFTPPYGDKPSLLTMDEVSTLLHELGHVLHHILSEVDELPITGIRGVEWDAVELPSQFMENFAWHYEILSSLSGRMDSGEKLPQSLFDKMVRAKNFQSGLATLRQIEFSLFDWRIHRKNSAPNAFMQILKEVREEIALIQPPPFNRFPHSFAHIFAGGYSAGYYSYKWAEVLSCDGFELFEEQLPQMELTRALAVIGEKFRQEILSVGGARPANESFFAYRGRAPQISALLRMNGLIED